MSDFPLLRPVSEIPAGMTVLLRMDLDVPMENGKVADTDRLKKSLPTIQALLEKQCTIILLGHLGRPKGIDPKFSLKPVFAKLVSLLKNEIRTAFVEDIENEEVIDDAIKNNTVICLENLRFYKGEEENDPKFLQALVKKASWFVNDAFAVAHRRHWSIMLFARMQTAYGIAFIDEVKKIIHVIHDPLRPLTIVLGGAKEDKLSYLPGLEIIADHILIGGKLPLLAGVAPTSDKILIATLNEEKKDLSVKDIEQFTAILHDSKTIVWAGAMGMFEDPIYQKGTVEIAKAVVTSGAYTILAGGDTEASVSNLGEEKKINLIASGGGVMLELLTKGTLPAW